MSIGGENSSEIAAIALTLASNATVFAEPVENVTYGVEPRSLHTFLHRLAQEQAR